MNNVKVKKNTSKN